MIEELWELQIVCWVSMDFFYPNGDKRIITLKYLSDLFCWLSLQLFMYSSLVVLHHHIEAEAKRLPFLHKYLNTFIEIPMFPSLTGNKSALVQVIPWHQTCNNPLFDLLKSVTPYTRADYRFAHSQWETPLLCNNISHWLCTNLESALISQRHNINLPVDHDFHVRQESWIQYLHRSK